MNTPTPITCVTCRSMATHEDCDKDGGCLHLPEDYAAYYRAAGDMPPLRYRHWVESTPQEQMARLHALQLSGARNIVLGPGEAEVNTRWTPQEASEELHRVAEQCGYGVDNLTHDAGDGKRSLTVHKDFGPFRLEWEGGKLARIFRGQNKIKPRIFWSAEALW